MASSLNRRQLLRADPHGLRQPVRPPWATARFHDDCSRCGDCLPACPERILVVGDGGFPAVDFRRGECTFCAACVAACAPAALRRPGPDTPPWSCIARIADDCLEAAGVHCHACVDPCPHQALTFPPGAPRGSLPRVDAGTCSGCGACVAPCPVGAVRIGAPTPARREIAA